MTKHPLGPWFGLAALLLQSLPASAHVVEDAPTYVFGIASYVARIDSAPIIATHNSTLTLSVTSGGVMAGHPVASTRVDWNASRVGDRLNGSFALIQDGRWTANIVFPHPGNWSFTLTLDERSKSTTTVRVQPHLGYTAQPLAPTVDPPMGVPFDFRFRFIPELEHPNLTLPTDARVRLELRRIEERVNLVSEAVATNRDESWVAALALPDGAVYHITIASASGGFDHDGLTAFTLAASPNPVAPPIDNSWRVIGVLAAGLALVFGIRWFRGRPRYEARADNLAQALSVDPDVEGRHHG